MPWWNAYLVAGRVHAEDPRRAGGGTEKVQEALDGRGLAGAIAAEEPVAAARLDEQIQAVDRLGAAVTAHQVPNLDGRRL